MLKKLSYFVTTAAIIATFGIGIYAMGDSVKISGVFILLLVILPYLLGIWVLSRMKLVKTIRVVSYVLLAISILGTAMLVDAMFIHTDAQGGVTFFVLPVFQFPAVLLSAVYGFLAQRRSE